MALPLTAVRIAGRYGSPTILLNQGTYLENVLFEHASLPHIRIPPHGTVAGTALYIAHLIGKLIVFAGLDLENRDIQCHSRPHAFDPLLDYAGTRTSPALTYRYYRRYANDGLDALETYAGWFNSVSAPPGIIYYRLNPGARPIDTMRSLDNRDFSALCSTQEPFGQDRNQPEEHATHTAPAPRQRTRILRTVLVDAAKQVTKFVRNLAGFPADLSVFLEATPLSLIYFLASSEFLGALKERSLQTLGTAAEVTTAYLDELVSYVESWRTEDDTTIPDK
jgi:hypothetical protein